MNLAWWLETGAVEYPDKTAIINPDGSEITYSDLNTLANRIGNLIRDRYGVKPDDVVTTLAGETHWHVAIMFGLWKIGAVVCPLNRTQTYPKFVQDIRITKAKLLIVEPKFLDVAMRLSVEREISNAVLLGEQSDALPDFKTLIRDASDQIRMTPRANADLAIINFTTGTTGPSKGAMLPHGALITSYLSGMHWAGMKSSDRGICPLYLFHAGGLSIVLTGLVAHSTVILMGEPWNSDRFIDRMERYRPDWVFIMVPVMSRDLARNPRFSTLDCSGVKLHLAGEPVHPEVQKLWEDRGARTLILYGMTESMAVCVTSNSFYYSDDAWVGKGLVGKPNREFGDVKLIDPLTREEIAGPGIPGELCFRGDVLTPGYCHDPVRTRESIDPEGWFHTFDLAVRNDQGYFTVGGRTDDIISSGGEKLSLIEVENAILQAPFVKDAACIGVPHARFGHSPAAIIAPSEDLDEHELMRRLDQFLQEKLERWKRPRLVIRVDEVPRTLAKRTKIWPRLREMVEGVELSGEGVTTLTAYRQNEKR